MNGYHSRVVHELTFSCVVALVGAVALFALAPFFGGLGAFLLVFTAATGSYLVRLYARLKWVGFVSLLTLWGVSTTAAILWGGTQEVLFFNGLAVWLARCLAYRAGLFNSLADGALIALSTIAAVAALLSGQILGALWLFFLIQSCHPVILERVPRVVQAVSPQERFRMAHRQAEAAFASLASR